MHVLYLNYFYDEFLKSEQDLLDRYTNTIRWCSAIKVAGANVVSLVQRFHKNAELELNGVRIYLRSDEFHNKLTPFDNPKSLHNLITSLRPDVIHHNGWTYPLLFLHPLLPNTTSIVWQHHGGGLPQWYSHWHYKSGFRAVAACFFTSTDLSKPWKEHNIIGNYTPIYELTESSTTFRLLPQDQSRKKLNISGHPIFLWVGRLNRNKDPLTVLKSFTLFLTDNIHAKLYMIYHEYQLLNDVISYIKTNRLSESVILIGSIPHQILEDYFNAADYYLSGSLMEGSGFALIEAIACGCAPIITNIPSFRKITNDGEIGKLWNVGDFTSLSDSIRFLSNHSHSRQQIRDYFDRELNYIALGKKTLGVYDDVIKDRHNKKKRIAMFVPSGIAEPNQGVHIPYLYNMVSELSQKFDITVYSLKILENEPATTYCGKARVNYVPAHYHDHWTRKIWKLATAFYNDHRRQNFDILHGMLGTPTEVTTILLGKLFNLPQLISLLGAELANIPRASYGNMRSSKLKLITKWICEHATSIIVLTEHQAKLLEQYTIHPKDVNIIPLFMDSRIFHSYDRRMSSPPIHFIHVASLNAVKDQETLLKAFAVIRKHLSAELRIIGPDYMNGKIHQVAKELGLNGSVEFLGHIPHHELPTQYEWADIMMHTSIFETQGLVVAEAAASGVVVCGTNVGLIADFQPDRSVAVPVGDYKALAHEVLGLLQNKERLITLRQQALEWSQEHDLNQTISQMEKLYHTVISKFN